MRTSYRTVLLALLSTLSIIFLGQSATSADVAQVNRPIWQPCSYVNVAPCIQSLSLVDRSGKVLPATPKSPFDSSYSFGYQNFVGNLYHWDVPGLKQPNGNSELFLTAEWFPLGTPYCWAPNQALNTCDYGVDSIRIAITPFGGSATLPVHFPLLPSDRICGTVASPQLFYHGWDLSDQYQYQVTLKMPPNFSVAMMVGEGGGGFVTKSVASDGSPLVILTGAPALKTFAVNSEVNPNPDDQSKAVTGGVSLTFYVQSTVSQEAVWTNGCNGGQTLSFWRTSIIGNTPFWSKEDDSIEMQMGGPHFLADGSLNTGLFQIQVPVTMAQCLWGVDLGKAIKATVSATYADSGSSEVLVTTANIRSSYYVLTSSGFHYSSPLLKMKLQQDASGSIPTVAPLDPPTPTPVVTTAAIPAPAPTATPVTVKRVLKKSITCTKGKNLKVISGTAPKCPSGYILKK